MQKKPANKFNISVSGVKTLVASLDYEDIYYQKLQLHVQLWVKLKKVYEKKKNSGNGFEKDFF